MSASRSFIDVLVGKLTAYVDASSRPALSIQTPWWVPSLDTPSVPPTTAARAYANHAATNHTTSSSSASRPAPSVPWFDAIAHAVSPLPAAPNALVPERTPAELTAIQLLRGLGATTLTARSTDLEIRSAWRQLLRECHPDSHPHAREADRVVLNARVRAVIRARDVLEAAASIDRVAA